MYNTLEPADVLVSTSTLASPGLDSLPSSPTLVRLGVVVTAGNLTPVIDIGSSVEVGVRVVVAVGARVSVTVLVGKNEVAI